MVVTDFSKAKCKPEGNIEVAGADQIDDVGPSVKSFDEAAGDKPLHPLPHKECNALQQRCWSVVGSNIHTGLFTPVCQAKSNARRA